MNLNDMPVTELRKLAASFGISGRSTMKKAELVAALSAPEIVNFVELSVTVDKMDDAEAVEAATKEHEDEEIDLTSTIDAVIDGWLPEEVNHSDHNPHTDGRPAAIDVVGNSVAAMIDQLPPNRIRFNRPPVQQFARTYTNEVAILRDAPGRAIVTAAFDGRTVGGSIVRRGKTLVLTAGSVRVTGNTFEKVAKRLAKALDFHADRIDVARSF
jgi:Rho termination factor-like protein